MPGSDKTRRHLGNPFEDLFCVFKAVCIDSNASEQQCCVHVTRIFSNQRLRHRLGFSKVARCEFSGRFLKLSLIRGKFRCLCKAPGSILFASEALEGPTELVQDASVLR